MARSSMPNMADHEPCLGTKLNLHAQAIEIMENVGAEVYLFC